jgi:hypothetical protein
LAATTGGGVTFGTTGAIFGTAGTVTFAARAGATNVVRPNKLTADSVVMRRTRPVISVPFKVSHPGG